MKRWVPVIWSVLAVVSFCMADSVWSADAGKGAKVFTANCASCHPGGRNILNPEKTLSKDALQKFGKFSLASLITQVSDGAPPMPAFGEQLSQTEIEDVAAYVLEQAEQGWQ